MAGMRATAINHVSIPATDVDASCRFYEEVFGMERIPSPNFGAPVRWLRLGDLELHLFQVDEQPPTRTSTSASRSTTSRAPTGG